MNNSEKEERQIHTNACYYQTILAKVADETYGRFFYQYYIPTDKLRMN